MHWNLYKMQVRREKGDLWFHKCCSSDRMATVIKVDRNKKLYLYLGGGAVDLEQSFLLSSLVVCCNGWSVFE